MCVFEVSTGSITGDYLYSDVAILDGGHQYQEPILNNLAKIPIVGYYSGLTRMALAVIHIAGHVVAGFAQCNRDHFYHVLKGCTEFARGFIESIPVVGRIFAWVYGPPLFFGVRADDPKHYYNYFLVRVSNINHPDLVDKAMRQAQPNLGFMC